MSITPSTSVRTHSLQLLGIAILFAALDQLAKGVLRSLLAPGARLPVLDGILQVHYVQNYRGLSWWVPDLPAWSIFILDILLLLVVLGSIPFYLFYTSRGRDSIWAKIAALGLTEGALGHLLDGLFAPFTVDFIQFFDGPSANLADLYGYIGLGGLLIEWFWLVRKSGVRWQGIRPFLASAAQTRKEFLRFLVDNIKT